MRFLIRTGSVPLLIFVGSSMAQVPAQPQRLGTEFGISAFERECTKCHGNAAVECAPSRIYAALITAVQIATGEKHWSTRLASSGSRVSYAATSSAMPGAVFIGGTNGEIHAQASPNGRELWSFDTARDFTTVNRVPAGRQSPEAWYLSGQDTA